MKKLFRIILTCIIFILTIFFSNVYARRYGGSYNIKILAILPFENLSNVPKAAEDFREALIGKIKTAKEYTLIDDQQIERILIRLRVRHIGYLSTEKMVEITRGVGADALLMGSILSYSTGDYPQISVRIQVIKINKIGNIRVINDIIHTSMEDDKETLLGLGKLPIKELVANVVSQVHEELYQ